MNVIKKLERAYNCLDNYRNSCDSENHKKFIDIFFPMFYQQNKHRLEISVGKKISNEVFQSLLTTTTKNFNVVLTQYGNEPQFIIREFNSNNSITCINLALIKDLEINTIDNAPFDTRYKIDFNYNNEIDYRMWIVVEN